MRITVFLMPIAIGWMASSAAALAQQPPPQPPPPQFQPPPPPQPAPPSPRGDGDNGDNTQTQSDMPSLVVSRPPSESMATIRPFDDPALGFGNDDLWNWPGAARHTADRVATVDARGDSDIAVGGGPD